MGTRPLAEYESAAWEYLLADPLGSVRQIGNADGNVTLLKSYEPYGTVLNSQGNAASVFAYAGEQVDATGLVYLRARYYQALLGMFLSRDAWAGDALRPGSMNGWGYVEGDPINAIDPTGHVKWQGARGPEEKAIEWAYENQVGVANAQLEYPIPLIQLFGRPSWCPEDVWEKFTQGFVTRPDIIRSDTGAVYEIEPLFEPDPLTAIMRADRESDGYSRYLNEFGEAGLLHGTLRELGSRYNWNRVRWHQGSPTNFPPMFLDGIVFRNYSSLDRVVIGFDVTLTAFSPQPGVVLWYKQINPDLLSLPAYALADRLRSILKREKKNLGIGMPPHPVPVGAAEVERLIDQKLQELYDSIPKFYPIPVQLPWPVPVPLPVP
jgi:RHS repeat-associated protein